MKERQVLRQITDYLTAKRIFWFRLNTGMAVLGDKKRVFRAHSLGPGAADILALPADKRPLWIECKNERGQQTVVQMGFERTVKEHGHDYVVARSIDDLAEWI